MQIQLTLDQNSSYPCGSKIEGNVDIILNQHQRITSVYVLLEYKIKGSSDRVILEELLLFTGDLNAGKHRFFFVLNAPFGPLSYIGEYIHLNWRIRAGVRISSSPQLKRSLPIQIIAPQKNIDIIAYSNASFPFQIEPTLDPDILHKKQMKISKVLVFLASIIAGKYLFSFLITLVGPLNTLLLFALLAMYIGYYFYKNFYSNPIGEVKVKGIMYASPGERVPIQFQFTPTKDLQIKRLIIRMEGQEISLYQRPKIFGFTQKKGRRILQKNLAIFSKIVVRDRIFPKGERVLIDAEIQLPDTAPYSFSLKMNCVRWKFSANLIVKNGRNWKTVTDFIVAP